ncbi:hypothetical protein DY052_08350 [Apilactobacillus timberlakei]|uniref:hypothetical protein n=1 Tax=Apilactobacillus timberlakei TaxID=2008380 RepID=UPI001125B6BF|nr:hypothetical protein [Apilactobacillus timberlakei]TPR13000.1 hypothetical protein DY052_08350 [Apilactobacillus timberlakei]
MQKTNYGVIDKITHPMKLYGPILLTDIGVIVLYVFLFSSAPSLFQTATSPIYFWAYVISMGLLFLYLRLPSGSNPQKSNFKMIFRDIFFKHNQFYQSLDASPNAVEPLKLNAYTKNRLDQKL